MKTITETEIRIGNLVDFVGKPRKIKFQHDFMRAKLGMFNPIPLSPELLEKAGAKVNGKVVFLGEWFEIELVDGFYWFLTFGKDVKVLYLHQLQNLYHSLTGEELKIEL